MRQIKLTIAATETSCGDAETSCRLFNAEWGVCDAFAVAIESHKYDAQKRQYLRLPECIAAEKEAGK